MYDLNDMNKPVACVLREWTKTYGSVYGIQEGLRRTLVVSDVGMIRDLFIKQYDYFHGRKVSVLNELPYQFASTTSKKFQTPFRLRDGAL
ncbi:hypothetical protein COOONC_20327 [Cooperia oncophora]